MQIELMRRDVLGVASMERNEISALLRSATLHQRRIANGFQTFQPEDNIKVTILFAEPSTYNRVYFENAVWNLGARPITISETNDIKEEPLQSVVRKLSATGSQVLVIRHRDVRRLGELNNRAPVISAGDGGGENPIQGLSEIFTLFREWGMPDRFDSSQTAFDEVFYQAFRGKKITLIGDLGACGTAHSVALLASMCFEKIVMCAPDGRNMPSWVHNIISSRDAQLTYEKDPVRACQNSDAVYFVRFEKPAESESRKHFDQLYRPYMTNPEFISALKPGTLVMHPHLKVVKKETTLDLPHPTNSIAMRMAIIENAIGNRI